MKLRFGFVTNSSSSSFVIAFKKLPEIDEETLQKYPFLKFYEHMVESVLLAEGEYGSETERGEIYSTKEEYDNYLEDYYDEPLKELLQDYYFTQEEYDKTIFLIENGYSILHKRVDYCDTFCSDLLKSLAKDDPENFIILESD